MKFSFLLFLFFFHYFHTYSQTFIPVGHAHNDYMNEHPLFDALDCGMNSVEVDVCMYKNSLRVSHFSWLLSFKKTIQELYLDPLKKRILANGGRVYKTSPIPFVLMIEFKDDGNKSYDLLLEILQPYQDLLMKVINDSVLYGPVQILLSGNKPTQRIAEESERIVFIDGSVGSDARYPSHLIQRVSNPYHQYFRWNGIARHQPEGDKAILDSLVLQTHQLDRQLRFYACPNNKKIWKVLLDAGVDWLNVDDLNKFNRFYKKYMHEKYSN
jgi:hypothetical protein